MFGVRFTINYLRNKMNLKKIRLSDESEHKEMIDTMSGFFDNNKPQVGIFCYDYHNNTLFGVQKDDADKYVDEEKTMTLPKLHGTYWNKQHQRAKAKGDTRSIFYGSKNYTMIPRGSVFVRPDGTIFVAVGHWLYGEGIEQKDVIDIEKVRELIADEFNLDDDFEFVIDTHWDLGHGQ